jgi:hypothetical protein
MNILKLSQENKFEGGKKMPVTDTSEDNIPWCKPFKVKGFWNTVFAYGCTSNPKVMYKNQGLGRIVYCPYCNTQLEVAKYTRKGSVVPCCECNKLFRYRPSY